MNEVPQNLEDVLFEIDTSAIPAVIEQIKRAAQDQQAADLTKDHKTRETETSKTSAQSVDAIFFD